MHLHKCLYAFVEDCLEMFKCLKWCLFVKPLIQFHNFSVLQLTWLCCLYSYLCCTVHLLFTNNRIKFRDFLSSAVCTRFTVHSILCHWKNTNRAYLSLCTAVTILCEHFLCERLREETKFVVSLENQMYPEFYSFTFFYF